jgi:hypothetical protein
MIIRYYDTTVFPLAQTHPSVHKDKANTVEKQLIKLLIKRKNYFGFIQVAKFELLSIIAPRYCFRKFGFI